MSADGFFQELPTTSSPSGESTLPARWAAALLNVQQERDALQLLEERCNMAYKFAAQDAPAPSDLKRGDNDEVRSSAQILGDHTLGQEEKARLVQIARGHEAALNLAHNRHQVEQHQDAFDAQVSRICDAVEAVMACPAPDLASLRTKVQLILNDAHCDYIGEHADNPSALSRILTESCLDGAGPLVRIYQDLCRLTGHGTPALEAHPFDAQQWLAAFESQPNHAFQDGRPVYFEPDEGTFAADFSAWRALSQWQKRMVRSIAANR